MRTFFSILALFSSFYLLGQTEAFISGFVYTNGTSVANTYLHISYIAPDSTIYENGVTTNSAGYYADTIPNVASQGSIQISWLQDCNGETQTAYETFYPGNYDLNHDFICSLNCEAQFSHAPTPVLAGEPVTFTNSSINPGSPSSTTYTWVINQSDTLASENITYTFPTPGTYVVCLYLNSDLCEESTCQTITVSENTSTCNVHFNLNQFNYAEGDTLDIQNNSVGVHYFQWKVDEEVVSNDEFPVILAENPGYHIICLTAYDSLQTCFNTYCSEFYVDSSSTVNCEVDFTYSLSGTLGVFNVEVPNINYAYFIINGNFVAITGTPFTYDFQSSGSYDVCLYYADSTNNCFSEKCQNIIIENGELSYFLSGNVYAPETEGDSTALDLGWVILFNDSLPVDSFHITPNSPYFEFTVASEGNYFLRAFPDESSNFSASHIPTYFENALYWEEAKSIVMDGSVTGYYANIFLISSGETEMGSGSISGNISSDDQNKAAFNVEGTSVILFSESWETLAFQLTNSDGNYLFQGLPNGIYHLTVEYFNHDRSFLTVVLDDENPESTKNNFEIEGNTILEVESLNLNNMFQAFPNPFQDEITLFAQSEGKMEVRNLLGQLILTQKVNPGKNQIYTSQWPKGIIFISVSHGEYLVTIRMVREE